VDEVSAQAQRVEHAIEERIEQAEQSIKSTLGTAALARIRTALRAFGWLLVLAYFGAASIVLATRYLVLPTIDQWRPRVEAAASEAMGVPVSIARIDASWRGLNPHFALNDVRLVDPAGSNTLALPRVEATISWSSLLKWRPHFLLLRVHAPEVDVVLLPDGKVSVASFVIDPRAAEDDDDPQGLDWLLAQGEVDVTDARVHLRDERSDVHRDVQFENVNVIIVKGWGSHSFGLTASPPASLAAPLDMRGRIRYPPFEPASDFTQWRGEVFAQVDYIDLAQLNAWVQAPLQVERAHGASRLWVRFDQAELVQVTADVALKDFDVRFAPDLEPLRMSSCQGRLSQQRWGNANHGGQALAASRLTFTTRDGQVFPPLDLTLRTTRSEKGRPAHTDLTASRIDLSSLAVVATHVPVAREMRELISRHAVRGELSDVSLSWDGPQPEATSMSLKMRFSQLVSAAQFGASDAGSARAGERLPGFENLSGTIDVANGAGRLQLASRDAVLVFPGTFEQPRLAFAQINGGVQWKTAPALEIRFDAFTASNADLEVTASGSWTRRETGAGMIDLTARIPRLDATTAYRYVPQGAGAGTLAWLEHALLAGRVSDGTVRIRGDLDRFPFVQPADGEFKVTARVRDATLDVAPAPAGSGARRPGTPWPLLTGIDADLLFERASMTITADRGWAQAARIENTTARIARFGPDSKLEVRGKASGTLLDLLQYVNASPVVGWIGGLTAGATASGNATLALQFELPLASKGPARVNGSLQLPGNDLGLAGVPSLSRVTGTLNFTEHGINFNQVAAGIVGGTARFDAQTRNDGVIVLNGTGMTTPAGLKSLTDQPQLHRVLDRTSGSARYSASLTIGPGSAKALQIESDLVGLTIDGVAPLRKPAGDSLPLRVDHSWSADDRDDLRVAAGRILGVHLERRRQGKEWQITRGVVAINEPANLPEAGLLVNVNVPRLDVDAWESWLGKRAAAVEAGARSAAASDIHIDLLARRTPELSLMRRTFRNVTVGATRADGGGLDANVASDNIVGHISWRPGAAGGPDAAGLGRISAQLSKLVIPNTRKDDVVEVLRTPTRQVPTIDLVADNFELGDARFGRLDLSARNTGIGPTARWRLLRLNVSNPDMKITASGEWSPASGGSRRMQLKFNVDTTDAGSALSRLGYRSMMARGHGTLSGDLDWLGSPLELNYPTLSGKLQLQLDDGRFTKVEPGNAARLLALLSLQALSRTLGSGAGDSFAEGFAFSSIVADATLSKGVLATQDLRMVGHSAAVVMSGTVNLNTETQQLHLIVLPEVDASTAALALTVVNPVLGLGTWLAQTVLRDPLSRALALEYDINGTWADPIVVRRSRFASNSTEPAR